MTDVVDIHDKESVEDGQIVRRRTIITLGQVKSRSSQVSSPFPDSRSLCDADLRINQLKTLADPPHPARAGSLDDPLPASGLLFPSYKSSSRSSSSSSSSSSVWSLASGRTLSISMSFDDLDCADAGDKKTKVRKSEAWYERRQSYGFEAADKLSGIFNTSAGSVSRSCDRSA